MATFLGEICLFSLESVPEGWALCDGRELSIGQNPALFSLLGPRFGASGGCFNLPDLRGRVVAGANAVSGTSDYVLGKTGGAETVALATAQMGEHFHTLPVASAQQNKSDSPSPEVVLGPVGQRGALVPAYCAPVDQYEYGVTMLDHGCGYAGEDKPHNNMAPYVALNYFIATAGVFPSR